MRCSYPREVQTKSGQKTLASCGRCMPCRINLREEWTAKIVLENYVFNAKYQQNGFFVTLTYNEEHRPQNNNLSKDDVQKFLKRLRKNVQIKWRYYCVGEYGSKPPIYHPHYHLIIWPRCLDKVNLLHMEKWISDCWKKGFIQVSEANEQRARYCAQYTTKKLIGINAEYGENDPLFGRTKEFILFSKMPGLGYEAIEYFMEAYERYGIIDPECSFEDSRIFQIAETGVFRFNNRVFPIPRAIKNKMMALYDIRLDGSDQYGTIEDLYDVESQDREDNNDEQDFARVIHSKVKRDMQKDEHYSEEGAIVRERDRRRAEGKVKRQKQRAQI